MTLMLWYLVVGSLIAVAALIRTMLTRDTVVRLVAVNVLGIGAFIMILALSVRGGENDGVLTALVITGLVIAVAFTGVGAVLIRRVESPKLSAVPEVHPGDTSDDDSPATSVPGGDA